MGLASFESKISEEIKKQKHKNLYRFLDFSQKSADYLSFTTNDYFAFSGAKNIANKFPDYFRNEAFGSGGSRLLSGNHAAYQIFEANLAKYKNTENALVFGSGYLTAMGVIPNICSRRDLVIADKHMHRSSLDAVKLSGAKLLRYEHNNNESCLKILKKERHNYANCLILTESLFSMDGDYADVYGLYELAKQYDSLLLVDDAHGLGIFTEYPDCSDNRMMIMGTMSKALGSYGGYLACSNLLKEYLVNKAASLIYSTSLPEIAILWANEALLSLDTKKRSELLDKVSYFCDLAKINDPKSPIIIIPYDNVELLLAKQKQLREHKIIVGAIRPPTAKTPRLRITISLGHSQEDLEALAKRL